MALVPLGDGGFICFGSNLNINSRNIIMSGNNVKIISSRPSGGNIYSTWW